MKFRNGNEAIILFIGDVFFWCAALWLTLYIRGFGFPPLDTLLVHAQPFGIIFVIWTVVFFISDLYSNQTLILKSKLPDIIVNAQLVNSGIAVIFFYFIPYFAITPKTVLFLDLFISVVFISMWRLYLIDVVGRGEKEQAVIVGKGENVDELYKEIQDNLKYRLSLTKISPEGDFVKNIKETKASIVILDPRSDATKRVSGALYNLFFSKKVFVDLHEVYENIFGKVPIALINDNWFLENISHHPKRLYGFIKRFMDILFSICIGLVSLLLYPFIAFLIKIGDGGPVFIYQKRVGQDNRIIELIKFRTMATDDSGRENKQLNNRVTRVGAFLRKIRLDELPQLWNVFSGDLSLIGPRPELPDHSEFYDKDIPYYKARYLISPGLSGWAQLYAPHPHHGTDSVKTKEKLSYDLYYIKNRGVLLDIKIALKTLKTILSRSGI